MICILIAYLTNLHNYFAKEIQNRYGRNTPQGQDEEFSRASNVELMEIAQRYAPF